MDKTDELQKVHGDISFLCEYVREKMAKTDSLWSKLILEVEEKLELRGKLWELEVGVRDRERVVDRLKAEMEDLNKRIQEYWKREPRNALWVRLEMYLGRRRELKALTLMQSSLLVNFVYYCNRTLCILYQSIRCFHVMFCTLIDSCKALH